MPSDAWFNRFFGRLGAGVDLPPVFRDLRDEVDDIVLDALMEVGDKIVRRAWGLANVSPGEIGNANDGTHMRDNIRQHRVEENERGVSLRIGVDLSNVPYAADQEFGPRGKPYLRPAFEEYRGEVERIVTLRVKQEMGAVIAGGVRTSKRMYRGSAEDPRGGSE